MRKKEKMEKSKYWRRNDGFLFEPERKVTLLIDMVFFAGISMSSGWIIRNVFLLVSDSTQFFFFKKGHKVKGKRESQWTTTWQKNIKDAMDSMDMSFLQFFLSAGLVFDQAVAGFVVFHFHSHEKKLISLLITMQPWLKSYLKTESRLKLNRCLSKRWLAQFPEKYLWADFVYKAGDFSIAFFSSYIFCSEGTL